MAKCMLITSGKGGVGKTTLTANVGAALALRGKNVVLIDTDIGLRNLDVVMGLENRIVYNLIDVIKKNCKLEQALIKDKRIKNLQLLAASQQNLKEDMKDYELREVVDSVLDLDVDYCLLDCPAGIEIGFMNAAKAAKEAIVVTQPEVSAIRDADRVVGLLSSMEVSSSLVINKYDRRMAKSGRMLDYLDVKDILGIDLIGVIPEDREVLGASNIGLPIVLNGKGNAKKEFEMIAARIDGEPMDDKLHQGNIWGKIKEFLS